MTISTVLSRGSSLTVLSLFALFPLGGLEAQNAILPANFQASSQMVMVPVAVTDRGGRTLNGLRQEDFTVLDNQKPQQIVSFSSEDVPSSVGLVLDTSGSMRNALGTAKDVAHSFLKTANPEDEFLLLTVSTEPDTISGFTRDAAELDRDIQSARTGGLTALIDTVYLGLSHMHQATRSRRALLIISDGIDNHSRYSKRKLLRIAVEADVQIYTIILDTGLTGGQAATIPFRPSMIKKPVDQGQEAQGPALLEELAEKTGGLHFRVRNAAEAQDAAVKVGRALRNQYVIGYRPPEAESGKWRKVRVKLDVPDANVYARDGYYTR
jgi:Ca-activated chloride channel family protein